jgi:uncharacterized protein
MGPNKEILLSLVKDTMPYGKYKGVVLCNIPDNYIEWYKTQGFPKGKLGEQLETLYEIKLNGLNEILENLKKFK